MQSLAFIILLFSFFYVEPEPFVNNKIRQNDAGEKPVVVELFSSEGCSSCPPAAVVMHAIIDDAEKRNTPVYILDYHVDYWTKNGWKDVCAKPEFTARQRHYQKVLGLNYIYTPQAIVNGKTEMTGSDSRSLNTAIGSELKMSAYLKVNCTAVVDTGQKELTINYQISGNHQNGAINFALFQKNVSHKILRGENKGATLSHKNVVVSIDQDFILKEKGKKIIHGLLDQMQNYGMLVFIQDTTTMEIIAACNVKLGEK